jgi:hypothetical protein
MLGRSIAAGLAIRKRSFTFRWNKPTASGDMLTPVPRFILSILASLLLIAQPWLAAASERALARTQALSLESAVTRGGACPCGDGADPCECCQASAPACACQPRSSERPGGTWATTLIASVTTTGGVELKAKRKARHSRQDPAQRAAQATAQSWREFSSLHATGEEDPAIAAGQFDPPGHPPRCVFARGERGALERCRSLCRWTV